MWPRRTSNIPPIAAHGLRSGAPHTASARRPPGRGTRRISESGSRKPACPSPPLSHSLSQTRPKRAPPGPIFEDHGCAWISEICRQKRRLEAGRVVASHARGRWFEPSRAHSESCWKMVVSAKVRAPLLSALVARTAATKGQSDMPSGGAMTTDPRRHRRQASSPAHPASTVGAPASTPSPQAALSASLIRTPLTF
jgi:hypothetical protein